MPLPRLFWGCFPLAIFVVVALLQPTRAAVLSVDVRKDSSYTILVDGVAWLSSGETFVTINGHHYSTADGSLVLGSLVQHSGTDSGGTYERYEATWSAGGMPWITAIRVYQAHVVFMQHFPNATSGTSVGSSDTVLSSFPSFPVTSFSGGRRGYVSFQGIMCGSGAHTGEWDEKSGGIGTGIVNSGPIVLFNADASVSLVLGAYSNFMAHSQDIVKQTLHYGVLGSVTSVPAGFILETLVVLSQGVTNAMLSWGDQLLARYGKERYGYKKDYIVTHLGYSTDNGAYYYYQTESGLNYEDTLIDVKKYADQVSLPYRHVLLDSWWYYKGVGSGVSLWDARPDVFPNGLEYLYNQTGWVQQLHNRYWASNTTYAKQNGGQWDFIINEAKNIALPTDAAFWDMLLREKRTTGMYMYEQDWLNVQYETMPELGESATLGRQWMMQMGEAAARNGVTMQECMSRVRHVLQSVELPAITNARASGDYHPGSDQWNIGTSSILALAVGIAPTKDNFWSTAVQKDTHYGPDTSEPYSRLHAAASSFSNGPVAPSDKIGSSDVALIMRACMTDGTLLQATVPATAIDAQFTYLALQEGANGEVWTSYTQLASYRVGYVLAVNLASAYKITLGELGFAQGTQLVAVEANTTTTTLVVDATHPLTLPECGRHDFRVYTLSPVVNGWAVLGEPDKWVGVSEARFQSLSIDEEHVSMVLRGAPGETVTIGVVPPSAGVSAGAVVQAKCVVSTSGTVKLSVQQQGTFSCQ